MRTAILSLLLLLVGCNSGDRPFTRAPIKSRTGGNVTLRLHQGLSKTGPQNAAWWQLTLDGWSQALAATGLAEPAQIEVNVYKDNSFLQWVWSQKINGTTLHNRPVIETWPSNIFPRRQGFFYKDSVYVVQGEKATTDGFALHLMHHIQMKRQMGAAYPFGDPGDTDPNWGWINLNNGTGQGWNASFWNYAAGLKAFR